MATRPPPSPPMGDYTIQYSNTRVMMYEDRGLTMDLLSCLNILNYNAPFMQRRNEGWREGGRRRCGDGANHKNELYEKIMYVNIIVNFIEFIIDLSSVVCVFESKLGMGVRQSRVC